MKEPVHHIIRARLPWRDGPDFTECGRNVAEMALIWTRDEAVAQAKEMGKQRFSLFCCMTCMDTAERWPMWDQDPVQVMLRECEHAPRTWVQYRYSESTEEPGVLERELRAMAALAAAYPDEFREMVDGLTEVGDLASKRAAKAYRQRSHR